MTIRTRFAPSPTGFLHVGGARTALFNWLLARRHGGTFILRIEDTDTERSTKESIDQILDSMAWLGLDADEGPFSQMDRLERYQALAKSLVESGKAYNCYCSREELAVMREQQKSQGLKPRYDGTCKNRVKPRPGINPVVRFKTPACGEVLVNDRIHGKVSFDNAEFDDLVVLRSDGVPTYNFSVVVDDSDMGITHVVRGDDHLNNTPRQLNIMEALGISPPEYAHVPMILGSDGSRLSKRHGAVSVLAYKEAGYLPEAFLNYMMRLGWSHGDQEIFALDELVQIFDLDHVNESAASFDVQKLTWVNQQWMKSLPTERLALELKYFLSIDGIDAKDVPLLQNVVNIQRDRAQTFVEMVEKSRFVYQEPKQYVMKAARKHLSPNSLPILESLMVVLGDLDEWTVDSTQLAVEKVAKQLNLKMGKVAQPLRVAVTGDSASPGIGQTLVLLGQEKALVRIKKAVQYVVDVTE